MASANVMRYHHAGLSRNPKRTPHPVKGGRGAGAPYPKHAGGQGRSHRADSDFLHQRHSATLPTPGAQQQQQGRVRVQAGAGDKCVPPAKSKQKRRQAVPGRPLDTSALSMDSIVWSDQTYDIRELIQKYERTFPLIVKVEYGRNLDNMEDLSINQVLQIHSFDVQSRVHAVIESTSSKISVPEDFPMELYMKDTTNTQARSTLHSALHKNETPFQAVVTSLDESIDVSTINILGRNLTFTDTYTETFLKANYINDGWIDQRSIQAVPGFLDIRFSVATGMRDATDEEWSDYYGMFARSVRHLNFHLLSGIYGLIVEEDGQSGAPVELPKVASGADGPAYENLPSYSDDPQRSASLSYPHNHHTNGQHLQTNKENAPGPVPPRPYENWPGPGIGHPKSNMAAASHAPAAMTRSKSEKIRPRPTTLDATDSDSMDLVEVDIHDSRHLPDVVARYPQTNVDSSPSGELLMSTPLLSSTQNRQQSSHSHPSHSPASSPRSPDDEETLDEMFQSVLDVAHEQETLKQKQKAKRLEEEKLELERVQARIMARSNSQNDSAAETNHNSSNNASSSQTDSLQDNSTLTNEGTNQTAGWLRVKQDRELGVVTNASQHTADRPSYRSSSTSSQVSALTKETSIEAQVHHNASPRVSAHVSSQPEDASEEDFRSKLSQFENKSRTQSSTSNTSLNQTSSSFDPPQSPHSFNNISAASRTNDALLPTGGHRISKEPVNSANHKSFNGDINANDTSGQDVFVKGSGGITDMDSVPKNLDNLNPDEVSQCLSLLGMDDAARRFRARGVDGSQLTSLREDELVSKFQMTPFNASKLLRFARGWRP